MPLATTWRRCIWLGPLTARPRAPHAVSTEIRPRRAETHPILVGVMMDASILLPSSRAARTASCWKYCYTHSTVQCAHIYSAQPRWPRVTCTASFGLKKDHFQICRFLELMANWLATPIEYMYTRVQYMYTRQCNWPMASTVAGENPVNIISIVPCYVQLYSFQAFKPKKKLSLVSR